MATTPASVTSPQSRFHAVRLIFYLVLAILLLLAAVAFWFYSIARSALPQLDGKLRVAGLSAPVMVIRDAHGAPTIDAGNFDDLFFAQGYVTAQDRLFQMDGMRRFAAGEDRSHFEAYARGVNAYIEAHRARLPLEFRILRYSPRRWTPEDSAVIGM